jgi:hypothetical protein
MSPTQHWVIYARAFRFRLRLGNPKHLAAGQFGLEHTSVIPGTATDIQDSPASGIDLIDDQRISDIFIHPFGERQADLLGWFSLGRGARIRFLACSG